MHDFKLIREEFKFFDVLPSHLQNEIIKALFADFKANNMQLFFEQTEQGFQNYIVVRMYCRIFEPDKIIVNFNKAVDEVYFIKQGQVRVFDKTGSNDFLILPQKSWFGDYQSILQLRSSFCFRAKEGDQNVVCMCVDSKTLDDAFTLFPRSKYPLLKRSLLRRKAFMEQYQLLQEKLRNDH